MGNKLDLFFGFILPILFYLKYDQSILFCEFVLLQNTGNKQTYFPKIRAVNIFFSTRPKFHFTLAEFL